MVTNFTGGARNNRRRYQRQTDSQQDITGTPAYYITHRNNSHINLTRPRNDSSQQREGKRRKLNQGNGMPEFTFEHARRDLLNRGQGNTSGTGRKRDSDRTDSRTTPHETSEYQQSYRSHQPSGLRLPSSHIRWGSNNNDLTNDASSTLANSSSSSYSQVQAVAASRRSSLLSGSSLASNAFSQSSFSPSTKFNEPFALPSSTTNHYRWNDGANVPPQLHTDSISPKSNKDSLSIIGSSPPLPTFPEKSTTPVGTPPLTSKAPSTSSHHRFSSSQTTAPKSNLSIVANSNDSKAPTPSTVTSPATSRVAALRQSPASLSKPSPASSPKIPQSQPQVERAVDADSFSTSFYTEFIKLASSSTSSQRAVFYLLPPQKAEWFGPCCGTASQRAELIKSFKFENPLVPQEEEEGEQVGESWVHERMGLGCWKLTKEEFEEIEQREVGMKMLSLANLSIEEKEEEEEEEEEEVTNWNEWEWEEKDFDFVQDDEELSIQSRPRLALPPPPAHPRPITLTSINENYDELSDSSSRPQVTKITLSTTEPWNNPSPTLFPPRSDSPPPLTDSSTSLVPLSFDNNNEEEDFPVLSKSFLYKSAYEPFIPPPPPSSSSLKKSRTDHQNVVEIKLDVNERVLDNLTDESENELFDGDDDEIQDADEDEWLKNKNWGEYSQ